MNDSFSLYLKNAYWLNIEYGLEKSFYINSSAFIGEELCIWEYDNNIYVSDATDYVNEVNHIIFFINDQYKEHGLPRLLYSTKDFVEMEDIISILSITDYETKLKELNYIISNEKTMTLVDNKGNV